MTVDGKKLERMDLEDKTSNLESNTSKPGDSLLTLNDDCLLALLDFLQLKDLGTIYDVCKRLRILSESIIERKSRFKWVRFSKSIFLKNLYRWHWNESENKVAKSPTKYDRVYELESESSANGIRMTKCAPMGDLVENIPIKNIVIRDNESNDLNAWEIFHKIPFAYAQIEFYSIDFQHSLGLASGRTNNSVADLESKIQKKLEQMLSIGFWECRCQNFHELILKHCESMSSLIMHNVNTVDDDGDQFLLQKYPKLLHVQCYLSNKSACQKLSTFLQQNSTIKSLTWYLNGYTLPEIITTVQKIIEFGKSLEELFLSFADIKCDEVDLNKISEELKLLNERPNFKRIELDLDYLWLDEDEYGTERRFLNVDKLTSLKKLTGLYNIPKTVSDSCLQNLKALHLKMDQGDSLEWNDKELVRVARNILNVEELVIYGLLSESVYNGHMIKHIEPFVKNSPNLKVIILHAQPVCHPLGMLETIQEFNQLRRRFAMENTCKVTRLKICFRGDVSDNSHYYAAQSLVSDFIEVKYIHIVDDVFNINFPFKKFYFEEF